MTEDTKPMNLLNMIEKSSVHLFVFNKDTNEPIQYGSGCIVAYQKRLFLLSVNHVIRMKDVETYALIETGLPPKDGQIPFYRVGGFMFFDVFKLHGMETKEFERMTLSQEDPLDVTFAEVKNDIRLLQKGFNWFGHEITQGEKVFPILDHATVPTTDDYYGFFGHIRPDVFDNKVIKSEVVFHLNLTYQGTYNRFHLFNTTEIIEDESLFEGTSGAPIINSSGQLVGLVCSFNKGTNSVFAFPIDYCKQLIDISTQSGF
jgi:hypothetical protein